ncbi:MAG: hypothetical protein HQK73_04305 [Desulfamplus sp.]|nr:hypothetical protein [Desulfamplus sp.]MBF0413496.1 hypothetical protein [Desulfamplus sp.]
MSLTSIATPIWNEIAKTQELKTDWAKKAFKMSEEEMTELVNKEYLELKKEGVEMTVIKAVLDMKPLLLENEAISRHIVQTENLQLRAALPEVVTIAEAVRLASRDLNGFLTENQKKKIIRLLRAALN